MQKKIKRGSPSGFKSIMFGTWALIFNNACHAVNPPLGYLLRFRQAVTRFRSPPSRQKCRRNGRFDYQFRDDFSRKSRYHGTISTKKESKKTSDKNVGEVEAGSARSAERLAAALPPPDPRRDAGTDPPGAQRCSCSHRVGSQLLGDVPCFAGEVEWWGYVEPGAEPMAVPCSLYECSRYCECSAHGLSCLHCVL